LLLSAGGETFDTAPYGGSFHPAERFTRREIDRASETRKNFAFLLAHELRKQIVTRIALILYTQEPYVSV
ncbi:hypothetical protein, partial [uncultured Porphyromonas sp.]|uniref:hypothetical protein n=1 Tax=uncultured Porphyromonas sp. TaxID=159274 RepID=UPI00260E0089